MNNSHKDPEGIIDLTELMEIMDDDDELIKECFEDFINDSSEMLEKINAAIEAKDAENIGKSAHAIKGSLKYLAAHKAADIAYQIESMGRNNNINNVESIFQELIKECDKLKEFMQSYDGQA